MSRLAPWLLTLNGGCTLCARPPVVVVLKETTPAVAYFLGDDRRSGYPLCDEHLAKALEVDRELRT